MRLLLLRDRKPGHFRQVEGIALCVARITDVEVDRLEIRAARWCGEDIRQILMRLIRSNPEKWLRRIYGIEVSKLRPVDAIVGSGRPPMAAGILLSRASGAPYIHSGATTGYADSGFALRLLSSPRYGGDRGCVVTPVPSIVEPERLRAPRVLCHDEDLRGAELSLLVGGDAHDHRYSSDEWRALADFVAETARQFGVSWNVSTSRRTPAEVAVLFQNAQSTGAIKRFIDYRTSGPGSADELFAADAIVVTEDSISMINEGLAARRPVVVLKPSTTRFSPDTESVASYATRGGLAVLPIKTLAASQFARVVSDLRPPKDDPRDVIVRALIPVLGLDSRLAVVASPA